MVDRSGSLPNDLVGEDFYAVAESSPDFIALAWLDNRVAYVNPAGRQLVGLDSLDEALAHPIASYLTEEGLHASLEQEQPAVLEHGRWHGRSTLRHFRTNQAIPVEVTSFLVTDAEGQPRLLATFQRDIRAELVLEERLRSAERLQAAGRLAGTIAHDFNNLLTVIMGSSQLILLRDPAAEVRKGVEAIAQAAEQGSQITRELLTLVRPEPPRTAVLELNDVVRDTAPLLERLAGKSARCELALAPGAGCIRADPAQVSQVLLNLCANARDAVAGRRDATVKVETGRDGEGRFATVVVEDNGAGIAPEHLSNVLDPFFSTKGEAGTGLGLASVAAIVRNAGGDLAIESELGRGTTVTVLWPAVDERGPEAQPERTSSRDLSGSERVLLVEDTDELRRILAGALALQGYDVTEVADGASAVELLRCNRHQALVTDLGLPGMTGDLVAREARRLSPEMPVVLVSGEPIRPSWAELIADDGFQFLRKPFLPTELLRVLRDALDARAS